MTVGLAASAFLLPLFFLIAPGLTQDTGWEQKWDQWVSAAKKEGKVVFAAAPDPLMRKHIPERFTARFGIKVEYLAGRSNETTARLRLERQAGIYSVDVVTAGVQTMATSLYAAKMLDPLKPLLILPEVVDGSKWKRGQPWFIDPEAQYILRLFNTASSLFYMNTRFVQPGEMKSIKNLLEPKWQGKISVFRYRYRKQYRGGALRPIWRAIFKSLVRRPEAGVQPRQAPNGGLASQRHLPDFIRRAQRRSRPPAKGGFSDRQSGARGRDGHAHRRLGLARDHQSRASS